LRFVKWFAFEDSGSLRQPKIATLPSRVSGLHRHAAIFVAEIGDGPRFHRPQQLCSWAGLTPRHRESDTTMHRGADHQTRRSAAAVGCDRGGATAQPGGARRVSNIGNVAASRKLLTLVFYGLRDGHIRALSTRPS
jgi:hypothetical protein